MRSGFKRIVMHHCSKHVSVLLACAVLSACTGSESEQLSEHSALTHEMSGSTMGTTWTLLWVADADSDHISEASINAAFSAELDHINGLMSTWDPESELSVFNRSSSAEPIALHEHTLTVIDTALSISQLTGGRYDIALQPVIKLWGFGSSDTLPTPSQGEIDRALQSSGFKQLVRVNDTVRKRTPGLSIDVSSLAKGYAVDRLGEIVESLGIKRYLMDIGGELRARGSRGDGSIWQVGIESPDGNVPQIIGLRDTHIATSGSYRNYRVENGVRLSHIIDGQSGRPITHEVAAVSVVHDSTMLADAWATALLVVGESQAVALMEQQGLTAQLTLYRDGKFERVTRNGFTDLLMKQ